MMYFENKPIFFWKYIYCVSSVGLFFSKILTPIFDKFIILFLLFWDNNNNNYNKKQKTKKNTKTVLHVH